MSSIRTETRHILLHAQRQRPEVHHPRTGCDWLNHAAICLLSLPEMVASCRAALDLVPDQALFPPQGTRSWFFEGISFESGEPDHAEAQFTQEEAPGKADYLYVLFIVAIQFGRVGEVSARIW